MSTAPVDNRGGQRTTHITMNWEMASIHSQIDIQTVLFSIQFP